MKRSTERILVTHTGSLPRPPDLRDMVLDAGDGKPVDPEALEARLRVVVADVVARQAEVGIDVVSDGEMSKIGFATYVKDRLTGFEGEEAPFLPRDLEDFPEVAARMFRGEAAHRRPRSANTGPIAYRDQPALARDLADFKGALDGGVLEEAFLPAASPGCVVQVMPSSHYATREEYLFALSDALSVEYRAITEAGFLLQVDCPDLAMGRHLEFGHASLDDYRKNVELHVEALNHGLDGIDPDRVRVHVCWGNYPGPHHHDVPLRDIVDLVLRVKANGVSVEGANPRHEHEWKVWEDVELPEGKVLIPGVIDSVSTCIEHPELVAQRLERYASVVGQENVIAGTDCGFGTFAGTTDVVPAIVWAKLEAMAEGARLATAALF